MSLSVIYVMGVIGTFCEIFSLHYCDQYKMKKSVGIGTKLDNFEPNISPNDEQRDDGI